jgi:hypothetical protein
MGRGAGFFVLLLFSLPVVHVWRIGDIGIKDAPRDAPLNTHDVTPDIDMCRGECPVRVTVEAYGVVLQRAVGKCQHAIVDASSLL